MSASKFVMPAEVAALPGEQQAAIKQVLVDAGLLTASGEATDFSTNMPPKPEAAIDAALAVVGLKNGMRSLFGIDFGCAAARIAEAAAVVACASVPGGQIAIAACIAAAHVAANEACD